MLYCTIWIFSYFVFYTKLFTFLFNTGFSRKSSIKYIFLNWHKKFGCRLFHIKVMWIDMPLFNLIFHFLVQFFTWSIDIFDSIFFLVLFNNLDHSIISNCCDSIVLGISLVYNRKSTGFSTLPWCNCASSSFRSK